jgi:hypothetical protein
MDNWDTAQLVADDKRYVWHPFTSMGDWCASDHEPIVLVGGEGAMDARQPRTRVHRREIVQFFPKEKFDALFLR